MKAHNDILKNTETEQSSKQVTTLKFGHFTLNTSSFWLTLVCILCMYLVMQITLNIYMYNKMMNAFLEHEGRLVKALVEKRLDK